MTHNQTTISDDALLLLQMERGNKQAFNVLFEKYWEKAYSDAYKRVKEHDAAKDIVQEIFTSIWINRETVQIKSMPAYLHVAIRNKVIKYVSKSKSTHSFFKIVDDIPERTHNADAQVLMKEFLESFEQLLKSLPTRRQEIFRLHYQEGLPTREISLKLGISRKAVQNQLGEAVKILKTYLSRLTIFIFVWSFLFILLWL